MQSRVRLIVIVGVLVAGAGIAAYYLLRSKEASEAEPVVAVQMAQAEHQAIEQVITAEAVLYPKNQAAIVPKIAAPVHKFYVNRGSVVHAGQLVAELENHDLTAAVTDNRGAYEQAQAAYETTTGASLPEDMQRSEFDLKTAKELLDANQKVYDSRQQIYKEGAISRKDLDQASVALVQSKAQYELALQHLNAAKAIGKPQTIKSAAGQLTSAKGKFEGATAQLGYSQISSPIDGVVTDRPYYPGETAAAGLPLLTIMDTSSVIAKAHLPQEEAAALHVGDKASLHAAGDVEAEGKVTLVSPALDPNSTTVEVWVEVPNVKAKLRPGTTVHLEMVARIEKDAIVIPLTSILKGEKGETTVMVVGADNVAHEREVEIGIQDEKNVQITKGLKAGETVIAVGAYGLPDKTHVKKAAAAPAAEADDDDKKTDDTKSDDDKKPGAGKAAGEDKE